MVVAYQTPPIPTARSTRFAIMNSLEFHATFIEEADSLSRALTQHGLEKERSEYETSSPLELFRDIEQTDHDDDLSDKLKQHIDAGVDINEVPKGSKASAVWRCYYSGKVASMRTLIKAGAKTEWTPEQIAVALGEVPELPQSDGTDLFRFACRVRNIPAARAYISKFESGLTKSPEAVEAAVKSRAADVVDWLMSKGFDPDAKGTSNGWNMLERAVFNNDVATIDVLLAAGATPHDLPMVQSDSTFEMQRLFIKYGMNPAEFEYGPSIEGLEFDRLSPATLTRSDFKANRTFIHGSRNPEPFLPNFWRERMRHGRYSILKDLGYAPDRTKPVWSFARFGRTATPLPDGRLVFVAGEHEDHYDADFCIYADVTVLRADGEVQHFIYPKDVFPPTDFHTATLVEDQIWLIGCLGYPEQRKNNQTQVLKLSTKDFSITPLETSGASPGWVHRHRSVLTENGILVTGGKIEPGYRDNRSTYSLNLETLVWENISDSSHTSQSQHR